MPSIKKNRPYSLPGSFKYALSGVLYAFKAEPNLSIQTCLGITFSVLFWYLQRLDLSVVNLVLAAITMSFEMMNTSFEKLCDLVKMETDPRIKVIKDIAASAVLFTAGGWLAFLIYGLQKVLS